MNNSIVILHRRRKIIFHDPISATFEESLGADGFGLSFRFTVEGYECEATYEGGYKAYARLKDRERKRRKLRESCMSRQEGR